MNLKRLALLLLQPARPTAALPAHVFIFTTNTAIVVVHDQTRRAVINAISARSNNLAGLTTYSLKAIRILIIFLNDSIDDSVITDSILFSC